MNWKQINRVRSESDAGYIIEALGTRSPYVYVIWPPLKQSEKKFQFPHRIIKTFSAGADQQKANDAKQYCETHFQQGVKNAA